AIRGGSGKTIISTGIIAAFKNAGKQIAPFKKGPDYIDAGWLALAAGRPCYNLDTFLTPVDRVLTSFCSHFLHTDVSVIEGNRGLYDGIDLEGTTSTAELAKLLRAPVILCIDCTKSTRTIAAVVLGCIHFDRNVDIKGVILNRVAGARHENILKRSIEHHTGVSVLGSVPKLNRQSFPERHMGLIPTPEHKWAANSIAAAAEMARKYIDLDKLSQTAFDAPGLTPAGSTEEIWEKKNADSATAFKIKPRIGIIRDSAFQFYYQENIDALISVGAELVYTSPLSDKTIPDIDALYIGGGFPETHAKELSENNFYKEELKALAAKGLPIYAECGGLMYLGKSLVLDGVSYDMADVLPVVFGFSEKPQAHGYTIVEVERNNPYFEAGMEIRGHEFHYSSVLKWGGEDKDLAFRLKRGSGLINNRDGIVFRNVLATYTHIHALGTPAWAEAMIRNAVKYRENKKAGPASL
ncbi:MAG: hydrogenobyrinic acid a,c-diamide synthase (glutamine-hydrolyzing), partial [Proteobacteria bacterium]|nr:hydrogenobyrinic acid a,c-diamide synthase (glutamine-hydrolyzing) [Pseudomonadota bacterium]